MVQNEECRFLRNLRALSPWKMQTFSMIYCHWLWPWVLKLFSVDFIKTNLLFLSALTGPKKYETKKLLWGCLWMQMWGSQLLGIYFTSADYLRSCDVETYIPLSNWTRILAVIQPFVLYICLALNISLRYSFIFLQIRE